MLLISIVLQLHWDDPERALQAFLVRKGLEVI